MDGERHNTFAGVATEGYRPYKGSVIICFLTFNGGVILLTVKQKYLGG